MSRRALSIVLSVALLTIASGATLAGVSMPLGTAAAGTSSAGWWMIQGANLNKLALRDPGTMDALMNSSTTLALGNPAGRQDQVPAGSAATATLIFRSYARFRADVRAHRLSPAIRAVVYDPEKWSFTPIREQLHPRRYLRAFAALARATRLRVVEAPARDLVAVPGASCVRAARETVDAAYLRCRLVGVAAAVSDAVDVQAQADQPDELRYVRLVDAAEAQARASNPHVVVLCGLTTMRPGDTVANLTADAIAVRATVDGYWLNMHGTDPAELDMAAGFLDLLRQTG
jgi:hypothetical protein